MNEMLQVYLDCIVEYNINFKSYDDHRETHPFVKVSLYSRWLTRGLRLMYLLVDRLQYRGGGGE